MSEKKLEQRRQEILVNSALYQEFDISEVYGEDFARFCLAKGAIDSFCFECGQTSVFHTKEQATYGFQDRANDLSKERIIIIEATCTRHSDEGILGICNGRLAFCFYRKADTLIKIGQYPSKADVDFGALDPVFSKELEPSLRGELGRAVGLYAHGIGAGSFVYLRRIFESLIEEAKSTASKEDDDWDNEAFQNSRMPERIGLLHRHLPIRLVETAQLYSILSKGVHTLSEDDCLTHFDIVKTAILMILKQRHEEREYKALVKKLPVTLLPDDEKVAKVSD